MLKSSGVGLSLAQLDDKRLGNWFNDNLMNPDTFVHGVDDDPVGSTDIRWKYTEFTDMNNINRKRPIKR